MRKIMGKYGFLVKKHEFFLKKPILLRGLEKLRRQSDNLDYIIYHNINDCLTKLDRLF